MTEDFTAALARELQQLKTELQQDPRFKRMTLIEQLLAEYRGEPAPTTLAEHRAFVAPPAAAEQPGIVHHLTAASLTVSPPRLGRRQSNSLRRRTFVSLCGNSFRREVPSIGRRCSST